MKKWTNMLIFIIQKYHFYQIRCVLKVSMETNDIQYLTIKPILNVDYTNNPNITIKNQPCFSQIPEMRITFKSRIRHMTYDYYIEQRLLMCEIRLNQLLLKNRNLYIVLLDLLFIRSFKKTLTFQLMKIKMLYNSFHNIVYLHLFKHEHYYNYSCTSTNTIQNTKNFLLTNVTRKNIKTNLLEDYVEFDDSTEKQNKYFKLTIKLLVVVVFLFKFFDFLNT